MKISKNHLKNIEFDVTDDGFTVWVWEEKDGKKRKHWLLDGSCVKHDGKIRLGNYDIWKISAEYNKKKNRIKIINKEL